MNTKSMRAVWLAVVALISFAIGGCSKLALGPDAYSVATALDRVFEKQDPAQLTRANELISEYLQANRLSSAEAERLSALVAQAQGNDWTGARAELRELLFDQTHW